MKPVLVGSRALEYWLKPDFSCREGADWDVLVEKNTGLPVSSGEFRLEYHTFDELNNRSVCEEFKVKTPENDYNVMSLEGLALMKRSHLWRAYHFDKHITMYHKHLAPYARWGDPEWVGLLEERVNLTKKAYPQHNPSLDQSNEDFFDDAVEKKFDHDWIHELVAYYDEPLYTRLKTDTKRDKAWCEKDLWQLLSYDDKVKCVAEEAHVIACERFMIPSDWDFSPKRAYFRAVNKVCTTLTSGWFRDFAIDNFPQVIEKFDGNKFNKVKENTT